MPGQKHFPKSATAQCRDDIKTGKTDFAVVGDFVEFIGQLLFFTGSAFFPVGLIFRILWSLVRWRFARRLLVVLRTVISVVLCVAVFVSLWSSPCCINPTWRSLHHRVFATSWNCTVPTANTHVKNVLLNLFRRCLNFLFYILDDELVLLDFGYQLRIFFQLLSKLNSQF